MGGTGIAVVFSHYLKGGSGRFRAYPCGRCVVKIDFHGILHRIYTKPLGDGRQTRTKIQGGFPPFGIISQSKRYYKEIDHEVLDYHPRLQGKPI